MKLKRLNQIILECLVSWAEALYDLPVQIYQFVIDWAGLLFVGWVLFLMLACVLAALFHH